MHTASTLRGLRLNVPANNGPSNLAGPCAAKAGLAHVCVTNVAPEHLQKGNSPQLVSDSLLNGALVWLQFNCWKNYASLLPAVCGAPQAVLLPSLLLNFPNLHSLSVSLVGSQGVYGLRTLGAILGMKSR